MQNQVLTISDKHHAAAKIIFDKVFSERTPKYIITVTGEVGTGKSAVSLLLAKLIKEHGVRVKIMDLDNYYKVPPLERKAWRKKNGVDKVGLDEYNWDKIYENIEDFKEGRKATMPLVDMMTDYVDEATTDFKDVDFLIIKGLYSIECKESKFKIFIELSYEEAIKKHLYIPMEVTDEFRIKVMKKEQEVVQKLKRKADFFLDFDSSIEMYHL
jgi:uridine kinase